MEVPSKSRGKVISNLELQWTWVSLLAPLQLLLRCPFSMLENAFSSPTLYGSFYFQMFMLIGSDFLVYLLISYIDCWLFPVMTGSNFALRLVSLFGKINSYGCFGVQLGKTSAI